MIEDKLATIWTFIIIAVIVLIFWGSTIYLFRNDITNFTGVIIFTAILLLAIAFIVKKLLE